MNRNEILTKLESIFKKVFEDSQMTISENTSPSDLKKWDSLHQVMLITEIQHVFNVRYKAKEVKILKDVKIIIDSIQQKQTK